MYDVNELGIRTFKISGKPCKSRHKDFGSPALDGCNERFGVSVPAAFLEKSRTYPYSVTMRFVLPASAAVLYCHCLRYGYVRKTGPDSPWMFLPGKDPWTAGDVESGMTPSIQQGDLFLGDEDPPRTGNMENSEVFTYGKRVRTTSPVLPFSSSRKIPSL